MFRSERRKAESNTGVRESKKWDSCIAIDFSEFQDSLNWLSECNYLTVRGCLRTGNLYHFIP